MNHATGRPWARPIEDVALVAKIALLWGACAAVGVWFLW